jgi:MoxR-like ATPase
LLANQEATVKAIIKAALFTPVANDRWGLNLLLWGKPGIGKTSILESIFRQYNLPFEVLSPGERGEGAFGVTPVPQNGYITYPSPEWTKALDKGGAVFLDEINTAPPAILAPIMGIALARRVGGHQLGNRVRVLAAANPTNEAADGHDLPPPLANRFGHLDWTLPNVDEWTNFMVSGAEEVEVFDSIKEEARVLAAWPEAFSKAKGLVGGFLKRRSNLLHAQPPSTDPNLSKAWPSPRTWEMATRALASAEIHRLSDADKETFISAFIGLGASTEFMTYCTEADLPDPVAVLEGREKFKHNAKKLDRTVSFLITCSALVVPKDSKDRLKRATALWKIMGDIPQIDVLYQAANAMGCASLGYAQIKESQAILSRLNKTFVEANK